MKIAQRNCTQTYQRNYSGRKCASKCAFSFHCEREKKVVDLNDIKLYRVCTTSEEYVTQILLSLK